MRRCALVLLVALAPGTARARAIVDGAATALARDPAYVAPDAEHTISPREARDLRRRIEAASAGPIYVAILPARALAEEGGDTGEVLRALRSSLGRRGTYAVVAGNHFRAASTVLPAGPLATAAIEEHGDEGVAPTLLDFVDRVAANRREESGGGDSGGSGGSGIGLLAILGLIVVGFLGLRAARRRRERERQLAEVKEAAQEDLVALADDVSKLELDVAMPNADPQAGRDYQHALDCYEQASTAYDRARSPEAVAPVTAALEEGRFAMASAQARLEGRPLPERTPPCFFDPRHGPSSREVEWAPPGACRGRSRPARPTRSGSSAGRNRRRARWPSQAGGSRTGAPPRTSARGRADTSEASRAAASSPAS